MELNILIDTPKKLWFTSDTHYNHKNIVRGVSEWENKKGTRDFETIDEMNQRLVHLLNSNVGEDDILFHIGDFSFGGAHSIWEFRNQIKCKTIHLILGNHDQHIRNNKLVYDGGTVRAPMRATDLFTSVQEYLYLTVNFSSDISNKFFLQPNRTQSFALSHYPLKSWEGMMDGVIHLHGHVHLDKDHKWGEGKMLDVGVDGNDMKPYNLLTDIMYLMDKREVADIYKKNNT